MREKGGIDSLLLCKILITIAIGAVIASALSARIGIGKYTNREKMKSAAQLIEETMRTVDSRHGRIKIRRKFNSLPPGTRLTVTAKGSKTRHLKIKLEKGETVVSKAVFLKGKFSDENLKIRRKNPKRLEIKRKSEITVEVE